MSRGGPTRVGGDGALPWLLRWRALVAVFLGLILAGAALLRDPAAVPPGQAMSWIDALFTSASAVTLTGLKVREPAAHLTPLGQGVLALLVQAGGVATFAYGAVLVWAVCWRLGLTTARSDKWPAGEGARWVRYVVVGIVLIELAAALVMMPLWRGDLSLETRARLSLFHAISAFCNSGFTLLPGQFSEYRYAPLAHAVLVPVVVLGWLGFPVLRAAHQRLRRGRGGRRDERDISACAGHGRAVLAGAAALYLFGVLWIGLGQAVPHFYVQLKQTPDAYRPDYGPLDARRVGAIVADASFVALAGRTTAFATVPVDQQSQAGQVALMAMMLAGGATGGAAGGIGLAALVVLFLGFRRILSGRSEPHPAARAALPLAAALASWVLGLALLCVLLLSLSEPYPFIKLLLESISAATTSGQTTGVTADLTHFGRLVLLLTMILARLGPLVLLSRFAAAPRVEV